MFRHFWGPQRLAPVVRYIRPQFFSLLECFRLPLHPLPNTTFSKSMCPLQCWNWIFWNRKKCALKINVESSLNCVT